MGLIDFWEVSFLMEYLASMNTDACLGFPVMAHQSWGIAHGHCAARQSTLVGFEGRLSKGHNGKADGLCQKSTGGYCPCCARATRVAISPPYSLGPLGGLKQTGIRLWAEFGPWAPRSLAAMEYPMLYIERYPLPTGWDWAAKSLDFNAPDPVIRGAPGGEPDVTPIIVHTKAQNIAFTMPGN